MTVEFKNGVDANAKSVKDYIRQSGFEVADVRLKKGWIKATVDTTEVVVHYKDRTEVFKGVLKCFKAV